MKVLIQVDFFFEGQFVQEFVQSCEFEGSECFGCSYGNREGAQVFDTSADREALATLARFITDAEAPLTLGEDEIVTAAVRLVPATTADLIRGAVRQFQVHPGGTTAGKAQRQEFKRRWGIRLE